MNADDLRRIANHPETAEAWDDVWTEQLLALADLVDAVRATNPHLLATALDDAGASFAAQDMRALAAALAKVDEA